MSKQSLAPALRAGRWDDAEDATLRTMWAAGHLVSTIMAKMNRSEDSVRDRRKLIGLPQRRAGFRPPVMPPAAPIDLGDFGLQHSFWSIKKLERARALLTKRRDPHEVHAITRLALRECYRIAAEVREARRA